MSNEKIPRQCKQEYNELEVNEKRFRFVVQVIRRDGEKFLMNKVVSWKTGGRRRGKLRYELQKTFAADTKQKEVMKQAAKALV